MFCKLEMNQKVRIHADILLESYPGQTYAYYIEIIDDDDES
ncbi:DUF3221 domain-containing protein [Shouchella lonarensis]|uniref:Uncharacterized protein n=1 Tax=Shouchella lonarensis TaxID=1464122 RepID=A0A1G6IRC3_9BACI|nr:DUF3221 domain-containing protein [Shouchella lonarensis]SDC09034.1 Protein of unknown function [Shouchella lonarensis]